MISDRNENGQIVEGANIVIECNTDANPSNVSFRWFSNDKLLKKKRSNKLLISNITRDHHNNVIKCEANNSIGKSEESETLNIACKFYLCFYRTSVIKGSPFLNGQTLTSCRGPQMEQPLPLLLFSFRPRFLEICKNHHFLGSHKK